MIEIENVSFSYQGNEQMGAVNHLSLSIPEGQVLVLCGESGCGKTTVTRLMNGLIPNFYKGDLTGAIRVNDRDITKMPLYEIAENTGSVFQNPSFSMWIRTASSPLRVKILGIPRMKSSQG